MSRIPGEHLTWDDLADLYGERTGGRARTRTMDQVHQWAVAQADITETSDGYLTMSDSAKGEK